jgi:hypothetical protein
MRERVISRKCVAVHMKRGRQPNVRTKERRYEQNRKKEKNDSSLFASDLCGVYLRIAEIH